MKRKIKSKEWTEAELINAFGLKRIKDPYTPLLTEWLDNEQITLNEGEKYIFELAYKNALNNIEGWKEEDLKMKFIAPILILGQMNDEKDIIGFFDKTIAANVAGIELTVKADFILAKGVLDLIQTPYFHFQEYKPYKNPTGDSRAQLLEAFLIAQEINKNGKPLYGVDIVGKHWNFIVMEGKEYCISSSFDATNESELLSIIAILRKFKIILYEKLII